MNDTISYRVATPGRCCSHDVNISDFCQKCFDDSEGSAPRQIIERLTRYGNLDIASNRSSPSYKFQVPAELDRDKKFENRVFSINQIRDPNDPKLDGVLEFLSRNFDPDVLNSKEAFRMKLTGITQYGKPRPIYRCFYVTDEHDEILGVRVYEEISLFKKGRFREDRSIFYAIYIVLSGQYRGGNNIPVEMYTASLIDAAENSLKNGREIRYLIAECSSATERLQNKIGLKRVYLKNKTGLPKELEFYQPPMEFNPETGLPASRESAEHFMMMKTGSSPVTKQNVYNAVASLFQQYRSNHPREYFANDEAFLAHEKLFDAKLAGLKAQLDASYEVILLAKDERPLGVIEFEAADKVY